MSKASYNTCVTAIDNTIRVTHDHFGSYAYAAGFLSSQLAQVMSDLPAAKQNEILRVMYETAQKYAPEAVV